MGEKISKIRSFNEKKSNFLLKKFERLGVDVGAWEKEAAMMPGLTEETISRLKKEWIAESVEERNKLNVAQGGKGMVPNRRGWTFEQFQTMYRALEGYCILLGIKIGDDYPSIDRYVITSYSPGYWITSMTTC